MLGGKCPEVNVPMLNIRRDNRIECWFRLSTETPSKPTGALCRHVSCSTMQAGLAVDISVGSCAAAVAGDPQDYLPTAKSEERKSRLQLQRNAAISSSHHLQPKSLQVRKFDGRSTVCYSQFFQFLNISLASVTKWEILNVSTHKLKHIIKNLLQRNATGSG